MGFSIPLRVPLPPPQVGTGGLVRFLLALREIAVDRFDGEMRSWHDGRPKDGTPPDPWVNVLLTFDDSVNPLEVINALDALYNRAEKVVSGQTESE